MVSVFLMVTGIIESTKLLPQHTICKNSMDGRDLLGCYNRIKFPVLQEVMDPVSRFEGKFILYIP